MNLNWYQYFKKCIRPALAYNVRTLQTLLYFPFYKFFTSNEYKKIPIIINNRNRYSYLKILIHSLEQKGYRNIFIIDNKSEYPPLLEYYKSLQYKVFMLHENSGHMALWNNHIFNEFKDDYYVYTDSDLDIPAECPSDFLFFFLYLHKKYPHIGKVGFGLKTDDLPDCYAYKQQVREWENGVLQKGRKLEKMAIGAQIDTTFALYKKGKQGAAHSMGCLRTNFPYLMKHLPWYEKTDELSDEQMYYYNKSMMSTHWSQMVKSRIVNEESAS